MECFNKQHPQIRKSAVRFLPMAVFLLAIKRQTVRCDWLAVVNIMAAECRPTDASCVDYTNYTSPFYLCIIHDCTQTVFGRRCFHLRAIKQITAAATSSSSAESPSLPFCCPTKCCRVWHKCWPTNVGQQLLANICWPCVCGFRPQEMGLGLGNKSAGGERLAAPPQEPLLLGPLGLKTSYLQASFAPAS